MEGYSVLTIDRSMIKKKLICNICKEARGVGLIPFDEDDLTCSLLLA